jgi:hypothetical protein
MVGCGECEYNSLFLHSSPELSLGSISLAPSPSSSSVQPVLIALLSF